MNPPTKSKINITALLMQLIGIGLIMGIIPAEAEKPLTEITLVTGPLLIQIFRTWFTAKT